MDFRQSHAPNAKGGRRSEDATAAVISMLEENMRHLEDMQEEKIRMRQEHQEEKERLEEQMEKAVDEWMDQRKELEAQLQEEQQRSKKKMEEFNKECERKMVDAERRTGEFQRECQQKMAEKEREMERKMAECEAKMKLEKEAMEGKIKEFSAETATLAEEKAEMTRQTEKFRITMEESMAAEKAQAAKKMADFLVESERRIAEKEAEFVEQMKHLEADCQRKMDEEKQELAVKTAEFRAETEKLASEKAEMVKQMEKFRVECDQTMLKQQEEMAAKTAEFQAECEKKMREKEEEMKRNADIVRSESERLLAQEKAEMTRKTMEFRADVERLAAEKAEITRSMEAFRAESEANMAQEKEQMNRQLVELRAKAQAEREALDREKAESSLAMARSREEYERKMEEQKDEFRRESDARLAVKMEEMSQKTTEFREECERSMAAQKEAMSKRAAEYQAECDRKMAEKEDEVARLMADFEADCERKINQEKAEVEKAQAEFRAERDRLEREKAEVARQTAEFRERSERDETAMKLKTEEFRAECEKKMREKEAEVARKTEEFKAVCEGLAKEKMEMNKQLAQVRSESEREAAAKQDMERRMAAHAVACEEKMKEKEEEMRRKTERNRAECEQLEKEKQDMQKQMQVFRNDCESRMAEEKVEMSKRTDAFFSECEKTMEANEKEMVRQTEEFNAERKKMDAERAELRKSMNTFRADSERKMAEEEAAMRRKMQELHAECERKVAEEKAAAERILTEGRQHTEEQLQKERAVTASIMTVLKELPPLQAAMELGDLGLLDAELRKWRDRDYSHFGECKGVVEAMVKLAQERLITWRSVEHTWKDVLREVERLPGTQQALTQHSQRIFRALKESQLTKMDIRRSDPNALERLCEVILAWQAKAMSHCNAVQKLIVQKVVNCPRLGPFDFADLDICLRLVDRCESSNAVFLSRAQAIIEEASTEPKEMRGLLSHVETMLFFLKYAASEDLRLTHLEFRKQAKELEPTVAGYLAWAEREYPPGKELVRLSEGRGLLDNKDVETVLEELRRPAPSMFRSDGLGPFREIFYQWARAMHSRFDLLVLPHHTQVVTLLAFRCFLEAEKTKQTPHSLIAQVGTGEGKSMIVAALAIYVVVVLGKKVHVVVDDETLLERDFSTFRRLFDNFEVPAKAGRPKRPLYSALCVSEDKVAANRNDKSLVIRLDPEADICYCEAKHVQSFYASIARGADADFDDYKNRVLILDEVDALVIDEEPNEAFVYPNVELSDMATSIACSLARNATIEELRAVHASSHPAGARVCSEMVKEWNRGAQMTPGEDFVFVKDVGKYCALQSGRANPKTWSLALECRNFQDGLGRDILFQERLFVMSRPRVFRKYSRILGLSGSIGSQPERDFLRDTYRASFFEVPPFLKTCRGSPFHEAVPASLGDQRKAVYVEASQESQVVRLIEVALEARERVPVLVVAKDRVAADHIVDRLRMGARSRGLGSASEDVVRSLSRTLYEADPEQWKENLNRATMPVGDATLGRKAWRITVTDPRGGRGTDYRVDDSDVDAHGGLLLIPTTVPTSRRDWTQFLGRTARQDRRGQYCCVLNAADYQALSEKYKADLPTCGSTEAVTAILNWGDQEAAGRIKGSAALYHTGVRVNELCEEVFSKRPQVLKDPNSRERLVDICQRHRWMSVQEVTEAFARLPGLDVAAVPTEARDMGRPQEPPVARAVAVPGGPRSAQALADAGVPSMVPAAPKVVVFCLDWSASMMSRDTRTPLSRFEMCQQSVQRILNDQVRDCDFVSVVGFGPNVQTVIPPTAKGRGAQAIHAHVASLRPQSSGGTCFYDSVVTSLQLLNQPGLAPAEGMRWLICLTDGDDLGSQRGNQNGEMVNHILNTRPPANLNMVMITVGPLKEQNLRIMDSWVDGVTKNGGQGMRISEKDAVNITKAFDVVAECLAADVGGAIEC